MSGMANADRYRPVSAPWWDFAQRRRIRQARKTFPKCKHADVAIVFLDLGEDDIACMICDMPLERVYAADVI